MRSLSILALISLLFASSLAFNSPWEKLTTNANPVPNVGAHEAVAIGTKIYAFGGLFENRSQEYPEAWKSFSNVMRVFDTQTNQWSVPTTTGPVPSGRAWFAMAAVGFDIYIFGGQEFDIFNPLGDFYRFNTLTNHYTNLTKTNSDPYPIPAQGPAMVDRLGKLYLFGGLKDFVTGVDDLWQYTPSTNTWQLIVPTTSAKPVGRALPELKVWNGNLVMFGGEAWENSIGYYEYRQDLWEFDFATTRWIQRIPQQPLPRLRLHYASVIIGNQWHFHGGDYGSCRPLDLLVPTTTLYDLRDNVWREGYLPYYAEGPIVKRSKFSKVGNTVYLTGGYGGIKCNNSEQEFMNDVWAYDPTNIFVPLANGFNP